MQSDSEEQLAGLALRHLNRTRRALEAPEHQSIITISVGRGQDTQIATVKQRTASC